VFFSKVSFFQKFFFAAMQFVSRRGSFQWRKRTEKSLLKKFAVLFESDTTALLMTDQFFLCCGVHTLSLKTKKPESTWLPTVGNYFRQFWRKWPITM
jgi:hypothetical protein